MPESNGTFQKKKKNKGSMIQSSSLISGVPNGSNINDREEMASIQHDDAVSTDDGWSDSPENQLRSTTTTMNQQQEQLDAQQQQQQQNQLSHKETKNVRRLKLGMITVLGVSAIVAGVLSFWYLRRQEKIKFQTMFRDDASKVGQSLYGSVMDAFGTMDVLSTMMVTHANSANETWPLTTLPHYGNVVSKILSMSVAFNVWTVVLVDGTEQRLRWEEYSWNQRSFVNETLRIMNTDPAYSGKIPWNIPTYRSLHDADNNPLPYNETYVS
jgi:hypothetical protein